MPAPTPSAATQQYLVDLSAFLGRSAAACERSAARNDCAAEIASHEARRLRTEQALLEAIARGGRTSGEVRESAV